MIKVKSLRHNYNIITHEDNQILYSYETPVAVLHANGSAYQTQQKYSTTTSRHINKFLDGVENEVVSQSYINAFTI
jgi:hypothetical protein